MQTGHGISVSPVVQGQHQQYKIGDRLLGFGGDTILGVDIPGGGFHTLGSFWTLRGETLLYGAALALLSGFAGGLLSFVLTRLN